MAGFLRENSGPVLFSVLLHGGIVAALLLMAVMPSSHQNTSLDSVPVNATVVDSRVLHAAQQAKADRAAEQAAKARAAADAQAAAQQAAANAQASQEAKALEQQTKLAEDAKAAAAARAADEAKAADQARASQKAAADAQAAARAADDAKKAKAAAEAKAAADAKAAAKAAADAKATADAKAAAEELRKELGAEEHVDAVEAGPLKDRYAASLRNKIQGAWIKPPSAKVGIDCLVQVTQVPGGEVTAATVTQCNGDAAVRQSIENAVYRASPLPDPPDPALFQRNFAFRFKPDE